MVAFIASYKTGPCFVSPMDQAQYSWRNCKRVWCMTWWSFHLSRSRKIIPSCWYFILFKFIQVYWSSCLEQRLEFGQLRAEYFSLGVAVVVFFFLFFAVLFWSFQTKLSVVTVFGLPLETSSRNRKYRCPLHLLLSQSFSSRRSIRKDMLW